MDTEKIFEAFGGATRLAQAINISPIHAQTMKSRGSIPSNYWEALITAARRKRIRGVTYQALVEIAIKRAEERRRA